MTQVLVEQPPNFDELARIFPIVGRGVIFAWGNVIYNPQNTKITPQLFAHEAVHQRRQQGGIEAWWRQYVDNMEFRLKEEILGHRAELANIVEMGANRQQRRYESKRISKRLAGPLYGRLISSAVALREITA